MKKIHIISLSAIITIAMLAFVAYTMISPNKQVEVIAPLTCSESEYSTMVENVPTSDCSTEWVVVCGEGATWKYQCFHGTIESNEETLRLELEAAQKKFYELCEANPELVCG